MRFAGWLGSGDWTRMSLFGGGAVDVAVAVAGAGAGAVDEGVGVVFIVGVFEDCFWL